MTIKDENEALNRDLDNANEGSRPNDDLKAENAGETTVADKTDADHPHKAEELTKAGRDLDPNEGAE